MSNPNDLAASFMAMAQAVAELPKVQADLHYANDQVEAYAKQVQRLEMRLIDMKTELDAAHAAISKAEVERDHAEHMFLETDDRLNALRGLIASFRKEVDTFAQATEALPVAQPPKEVLAEAEYMKQVGEDIAYSYPPAAVSSEDHIDGPFPYQRAESAQGEPDAKSMEAPSAVTAQPTVTSVTELTQPTSGETSAEGVSVPLDPTPAMASSSESGFNALLAPQGASATRPTDVSDQTAPAFQTVAASGSVPDADAIALDDVGYHNEPKIGNTGDVHADWADWEQWQHRMDAKYGVMKWPRRDTDAPPVSRASSY